MVITIGKTMIMEFGKGDILIYTGVRPDYPKHVAVVLANADEPGIVGTYRDIPEGCSESDLPCTTMCKMVFDNTISIDRVVEMLTKAKNALERLNDKTEELVDEAANEITKKVTHATCKEVAAWLRWWLMDTEHRNWRIELEEGIIQLESGNIPTDNQIPAAPRADD